MKFSVDAYELMNAPGYWYLGSPYTEYPEGREAAWRDICRIRGSLMQQGIASYSPIVECHPVAEMLGIPIDAATWADDNYPKMKAAHGLIVVRLGTWESSTGLADEIRTFRAFQKPIVHMDP